MYAYIASTSRSIKKHLKDEHRISEHPRSRAGSKRRERDSQVTLSQYLKADLLKSVDQGLLDRLIGLQNQRAHDLVLLDLLLQRNPPFDLINSKEWQKYTKLLNPVVTMPGRWKMKNLVATEYARAVPFVKQKLATARGMIHLFRWLDLPPERFIPGNQRILHLRGLEPTNRGSRAAAHEESSTGSSIADEVAKILGFFGVEER
jgi:hypothetical protein